MQIVDMHCDTISELFLTTENLYENSKHLDLKRMKEAGYLLQNFALFVNKNKYPDVKARVIELMKYYKSEIRNNVDIIGEITCMADVGKNKLQGKMSAMLTIEEGAALEGSVDTLEEFYRNGVRMITLTWNYPNELGYPHGYSKSGEYGLTGCGFEIVEAMEHLGVIVDVSHLSDDGFYDVLKCTNKPFVASHSNARSVCPVSRNLSDEMIRALALRGGVMGLNFYPPFLENSGNDNIGEASVLQGTIESVVKHAKHIVNVGGVDVLGLGSDFDGIDGHKELPGVQAIHKLLHAFEKAGFLPSEIEKICGKNVLRVYKEVMG